MNDDCLIPPVLRSRAHHLCDTMISLCGQDPAEDSRRRPVVIARVFVCRVLTLEGWTEHQTGRVLGWDHSTVHYYIRRFKDIMELPGYDAERDLWKQFKQAI